MFGAWRTPNLIQIGIPSSLHTSFPHFMAPAGLGAEPAGLEIAGGALTDVDGRQQAIPFSKFKTGWCFQSFFLFRYIGNNDPN